jgi:GNAT superfamily N-acetyltransferase
MGPVGAGVVASTFYNFHPGLVAHNIPRAWEVASVPDILAARLTAADRALRRLLGDAVESAEVGELATLARAATDGLPTHGRVLFAAHADLPWPDAPHLVLWHAITLLREFRGDGHIAALLDGELSGLEALITHCATGYGFTEAAAKATRGWSDDEWAAGVDTLRRRGVLDGDGLTAGGLALRDSVERTTDRLSAAPWTTLGPDRTARLVELGRGFTRQLAVNGAWPKGVFAAK